MKEVIGVREAVRFNPDFFQPNILYISPKVKIPLICLDNGQEIPPHPSALGIFYVIDGEGVFTRGEEKIDIKAGMLIIAPDGVVRGIKSKGKLIVLAVHVA